MFLINKVHRLNINMILPNILNETKKAQRPNNNRNGMILMLKIKTLKPKSNRPLIKYIHNHGLTESMVGKCFGYSTSWFINLMNHGSFDKHDTEQVKKAVIELSKKNRGNK